MMHPGWMIILISVGLSVLAVLAAGVAALILGGKKGGWPEDMFDQCEEDRPDD